MPGNTSPTNANVVGSGTVAPLMLMSKWPLRLLPLTSQKRPAEHR
jgi:hypothetical protein